MSSTAAATLRQLVVFVVDKVVEEDHRMLLRLASELEYITLPDVTTRSLGPAARDAFAIFEDLCLLGNGERPQFLQLEPSGASRKYNTDRDPFTRPQNGFIRLSHSTRWRAYPSYRTRGGRVCSAIDHASNHQ